MIKKNNVDSEITNNEDFIYYFFIEQMRIIMNNKFVSYRESSYRNLKINSLVERYGGKNLALIEDNPNFVTFQDILDQYYIENNKDVDLAFEANISKFEHFNKGKPQIAINKYMKENTPNDILHNFVLRFCKTYEDFFLFRKEFTYNYSTMMYFSYILGNSNYIKLFIINHYFNLGLYLHNMIMQKNSGSFFLKNFKLTCCDAAFDPEKEEINDLTTFRLSPNLIVFS